MATHARTSQVTMVALLGTSDAIRLQVVISVSEKGSTPGYRWPLLAMAGSSVVFDHVRSDCEEFDGTGCRLPPPKLVLVQPEVRLVERDAFRRRLVSANCWKQL